MSDQNPHDAASAPQPSMNVPPQEAPANPHATVGSPGTGWTANAEQGDGANVNDSVRRHFDGHVLGDDGKHYDDAGNLVEHDDQQQQL